MRSCTHFFPHDFVRSISPGILSRWALRPWTWQVSKIPVFPMLSRILGKTPQFFLSKGLRWLQGGTSGEKTHIEKTTFGVFFLGGLMNERLSCGKNAYCFWKQPFLCSRFFSSNTRHLKMERQNTCIFRIFKGTFQGKFHSQTKGVQKCQI